MANIPPVGHKPLVVPSGRQILDKVKDLVGETFDRNKARSFGQPLAVPADRKLFDRSDLGKAMLDALALDDTGWQEARQMTVEGEKLSVLFRFDRGEFAVGVFDWAGKLVLSGSRDFAEDPALRWSK